MPTFKRLPILPIIAVPNGTSSSRCDLKGERNNMEKLVYNSKEYDFNYDGKILKEELEKIGLSINID